MIRRPPRSTRTDTLFPYTTLFRSARNSAMIARRADDDPIGTAQGIDQRSGLRRALFDIWRIHGHVERCAVEHNGFRARSEEHTSELQSLMRISYAVFCLKKKKQ